MVLKMSHCGGRSGCNYKCHCSKCGFLFLFYIWCMMIIIINIIILSYHLATTYPTYNPT